MDVSQFRAHIVVPGLLSLPDDMRHDEAAFLLTVIAGQESGRTARIQMAGPAHGFYQFEVEGVAGLMVSTITSLTLRDSCLWLSVPYDAGEIYQVIEWNDTLATICARLLLWADPAYVPPIGDIEAGWQMYLRCWRPGRPDRARWVQVYLDTQAAWTQPLIA